MIKPNHEMLYYSFLSLFPHSSWNMDPVCQYSAHKNHNHVHKIQKNFSHLLQKEALQFFLTIFKYKNAVRTLLVTFFLFVACCKYKHKCNEETKSKHWTKDDLQSAYSAALTVCDVDRPKHKHQHQHHKPCPLWANTTCPLCLPAPLPPPAPSSPSPLHLPVSPLALPPLNWTPLPLILSSLVFHCCVHQRTNLTLNDEALISVWFDWFHVSSHLHFEFRWLITECHVSVFSD